MTLKHGASIAIFLALRVPASAHRLDEYLQAALITVEKTRVQVEMRLTPGVAVFPVVLASIDGDADGTVSATEQRAYSERVLRDLSLAIDGQPLRVHLLSADFPKVQDMKEGRGEIRIEFEGNLPNGGFSRKLVFENHHLNGIAAYLVNCLVPRDPNIRVTAQNRNYEQSFYRLDYEQASLSTAPFAIGRWSGDRALLATGGLLLLVRLAWILRRRRPDLRARSPKLFWP